MDVRNEQGRWRGSGSLGLGWNLRLTEMQSAMGLVLLGKLDDFIAKRRSLAAYLTEALRDIPSLDPVPQGAGRKHTYFRYDCLLNTEAVTCTREQFLAAVRAEGVPCAPGSAPDNHLAPLFADQLGYGGSACPFACPWYQGRVKYQPGLCPVSEGLGRRVVTLEVWPTIEEKDCDDILAAVRKVTEAYRA
jgi:perosamine synthetase